MQPVESTAWHDSELSDDSSGLDPASISEMKRTVAGDGRPSRRLSPSPKEGSIDIDGVAFAALTEEGVMTRVVSSLASGSGGWLVNPNVDVLRIIHGDPCVRALVADADLVVADGMPLLWAARALRTPLPERVAGSTLIRVLARRTAEAGLPVFLLGGAQGVADAAAERLRDEIPGIEVTTHCPPFGFESDRAAQEAMHSALRASRPAVAFCGLGFPKQERLMAALHQQYPDWWFVGSGASLTFLAGRQRRAPVWMQRLGLEWVHRLASEPRRLARRYLVDDIPFALWLMVRCTVKGLR